MLNYLDASNGQKNRFVSLSQIAHKKIESNSVQICKLRVDYTITSFKNQHVPLFTKSLSTKEIKKRRREKK